MTHKQFRSLTLCLASLLLFFNNAYSQCKDFNVLELQNMCSYNYAELISICAKNGYVWLNPEAKKSLAFECPNNPGMDFLVHIGNSITLFNKSKNHTDSLIKKLHSNGYHFRSKDDKMLVYESEDYIFISLKDTSNISYSISFEKQNHISAKRLSGNKVEVNSLTNYSDISVKKGDKVYVHASGSIVTGAFSGATGPNGKKWIDTWNLLPNVNYGALLIGVDMGSGLKLAGENTVFDADATGKLEFRINDTDPSDNDGAFLIEYSINKPLRNMGLNSSTSVSVTSSEEADNHYLLDAYNEGKYGSKSSASNINDVNDKKIMIIGHWTMQSTSWDFSYSMDLKANADNVINGVITWTVNKIDPSGYKEYQGKLNKSGKEYVVGVLNSYSNTIQIHGVSKDDPFNVVGLDTYEVKLSNNNEHYGKTKTNGSWQGILSGTYSTSSQ